MSITSLKSHEFRDLPSCPGVYFFHDKSGKILYIGKAVNLKRRVSSYFQKNHTDSRIEDMVSRIVKINCRKTDSAIEALILEANFIRHYQPFYNIKSKDDKSFVNIAISKEDFPRVFVIRPNVERLFKGIKIGRIFGPYPSSGSARAALKILRKIFHFRGLEKTPEAERFYREIMLVPESKEGYKESIKGLVLFLEGKKKRLITGLQRQMEEAAKKDQYEKAAQIRDRIFALQHIQDVALLKESEWNEGFNSIVPPARIEAYDISNIFGEYAVGSMVVFTNGKMDTGEYRRFRIKRVKGISDIGMMKEILKRRFAHGEWQSPNLIIVDGGIGQLNAARQVLGEYGMNIPVIGIAKGPDRKGEKLFFTKNAPLPDKKLIVQLRDEAHRFAISYHRKLKRHGVWN